MFFKKAYLGSFLFQQNCFSKTSFFVITFHRFFGKVLKCDILFIVLNGGLVHLNIVECYGGNRVHLI